MEYLRSITNSFVKYSFRFKSGDAKVLILYYDLM